MKATGYKVAWHDAVGTVVGHTPHGLLVSRADDGTTEHVKLVDVLPWCSKCNDFAVDPVVDIRDASVGFADDWVVEASAALVPICGACGTDLALPRRVTHEFDVEEAHDEGHHTEHSLRAKFVRSPEAVGHGFTATVRVWCDCGYWERIQPIGEASCCN